jgi:hypothetical protein
MNREFRRDDSGIPLTENLGDPTDPMTENATTVYVNDSFNVDSIPFDVGQILEEVTSADIELE